MLLGELFVKEFRQMTSDRRAKSQLDINKIPIPDSSLFKSNIVNSNKVIFRGIKDMYFAKLNNSEAILLSRPSLKRRVFNSDGSFRKDNNNKLVYQDVSVPQGCLAVVSDVNVGVKLSYVPEESFLYVDYVDDKVTHNRKYIYIVPKHFCFKLNQCALVLSVNRLRSYYEGSSVFLQNGHKIYMHIIPFTPSNTLKPYRVLSVKSTNDFKSEVEELLSFWESYGVIFARAQTHLDTPISGMTNCGFEVFSATLSDYCRYNPNKSVSDEGETTYGVIV